MAALASAKQGPRTLGCCFSECEIPRIDYMWLAPPAGPRIAGWLDCLPSGRGSSHYPRLALDFAHSRRHVPVKRQSITCSISNSLFHSQAIRSFT
jgi:hypothetical protein